MRIALTFLTCDRPDLTERTLESLASRNDLRDYILLHGDDGRDQINGRMARALGFETVEQSLGERRGVARMTELLFAHAFVAGCDAVLNLQNDWECLRPIPLDDIRLILRLPDVYCVRLYGKDKAPGYPCGDQHAAKLELGPTRWRTLDGFPGFEAGDIHWGHPPAVTLIPEAMGLVVDAKTESTSRLRSGNINKLTARVTENVFNHIGYGHRTEGFKP